MELSHKREKEFFDSKAKLPSVEFFPNTTQKRSRDNFKNLKNMKKVIFLMTGVLLFFLYSCNKENENFKEQNLEQNQEVIQSSNQVETRSDESVLTSISLNNGILEFTDFTHFRNAVDYLEAENEKHVDNFLSTYSDLDDDELFDKEQELSFSDYVPSENFESSKGFSSRRAYVETAIQGWLNNEVLDDTNDPDDWDDLDEEMRTFFNQDGNIKIGGEIYHMDDFSGVESIFADGCKRHKVKKYTKYYGANNNKRFKVRVAATSGPLRLIIKTKVVSQKKKWFGWGRYRTNVYASVGGAVSDQNCIGGIGVSAFKGPKKRRRIKAKYVDWDPEVWHKFQPGAISGTGWAGSSNEQIGLVLNW